MCKCLNSESIGAISIKFSTTADTKSCRENINLYAINQPHKTQIEIYIKKLVVKAVVDVYNIKYMS
jgi:hypothetical protein